MSEEEKEAIDYLKNDVVYWLDKGKDFVVIDIGENEKLHNILNLIDKQKKEIEEKSTIIMAGAEKVKQLEEEIEELKLITRQYNSYCINTDDDEPRIILAHKHYFDSGVFTSNYISKDKIREFIKEIDGKGTFDAKIVLEHLLEEE